MVLLLATTWTTLPKGSAWADTNNKVICSQEGFNLCQQSPGSRRGLGQSERHTAAQMSNCITWHTAAISSTFIPSSLQLNFFTLQRMRTKSGSTKARIFPWRCPRTPKIPPQVVWFSNGLSICSCQLQPNVKGTLNIYRINFIVSGTHYFSFVLFICLLRRISSQH